MPHVKKTSFQVLKQGQRDTAGVPEQVCSAKIKKKKYATQVMPGDVFSSI